MEDQLMSFGSWLIDEAVPAGGLGPSEGPRVVDRHVADSVVFAGPLGDRPVVGHLVDLGSGVGLPGIPLAIVMPTVAVTLLDRSQRRCDLARRAIRVLNIQNADVMQRDFAEPGRTWDAATMRAVLRLETAVPAVLKVLGPGGVGILGLRRETMVEAPDVGALDCDVVTVPAEVLDSTVTLLRMRRP
jgi:16S rRNA (guanine527-N7)-methyltransferase